MNDKTVDFRRLRYFVTVAEELHFGRAARRLRIAQPPLSQQIAKLETELGCRLLDRTSRRVELTSAGHTLLAWSRGVFAQLSRGIEDTQRTARGQVGSLAIGFPASLAFGFLPRAFALYRKQFAEVHLRLDELTTGLQLRALLAGTIDIGFLREVWPDRSAFHAESVGWERFVAILPREHRLARDKHVRLSKLANEQFVLFPPKAGPEFFDKIVSLCRDAGFYPQITQEAVEWQTIMSLVGAGFGVTLAPESIAHCGGKSVVCKPIIPQGETEVVMCWTKAKNSSTASEFATIVRALAPLKTKKND